MDNFFNQIFNLYKLRDALNKIGIHIELKDDEIYYHIEPELFVNVIDKNGTNTRFLNISEHISFHKSNQYNTNINHIRKKLCNRTFNVELRDNNIYFNQKNAISYFNGYIFKYGDFETINKINSCIAFEEKKVGQNDFIIRQLIYLYVLHVLLFPKDIYSYDLFKQYKNSILLNPNKFMIEKIDDIIIKAINNNTHNFVISVIQKKYTNLIGYLNFNYIIVKSCESCIPTNNLTFLFTSINKIIQSDLSVLLSYKQIEQLEVNPNDVLRKEQIHFYSSLLKIDEKYIDRLHKILSNNFSLTLNEIRTKYGVLLLAIKNIDRGFLYKILDSKTIIDPNLFADIIKSKLNKDYLIKIYVDFYDYIMAYISIFDKIYDKTVNINLAEKLYTYNNLQPKQLFVLLLFILFNRNGNDYNNALIDLDNINQNNINKLDDFLTNYQISDDSNFVITTKLSQLIITNPDTISTDNKKRPLDNDNNENINKRVASEYQISHVGGNNQNIGILPIIMIIAYNELTKLKTQYNLYKVPNTPQFYELFKNNLIASFVSLLKIMNTDKQQITQQITPLTHIKNDIRQEISVMTDGNGYNPYYEQYKKYKKLYLDLKNKH